MTAADRVVYCALFVVIGLVIMTNLPPYNSGWFYLLGGGSVVIGVGFLASIWWRR